MDSYQITSGVLWNLYNTTREDRLHTVFSPHGEAEEITVFFGKMAYHRSVYSLMRLPADGQFLTRSSGKTPFNGYNCPSKFSSRRFPRLCIVRARRMESTGRLTTTSQPMPLAKNG
jgi:hypothetical protein